MEWKELYPRPGLKRDSFLPVLDGWTLNGREISLPWPPEAELSGFTGKIENPLRYKTDFRLGDVS